MVAAVSLASSALVAFPAAGAQGGVRSPAAGAQSTQQQKATTSRPAASTPITPTISPSISQIRPTVRYAASSTIPGPVTGVSAVPANGSASVAFSAPSSNGGADISSYVVSRSTNGTAWTTVSTLSTGTLPTTFPSTVSIPGLTNGTLYFLKIQAFNINGGGPAVTTSVTPAALASSPLGPDQPTVVLPSGPDAYGQVVTADAPVGWWRLHDASGATSIADSSSNNQSGAINTPAKVATGVAGPNFNGTASTVASLTGGTISVPNYPALQSGNQTLEAWFNLSALPVTYPARIVGKLTKGENQIVVSPSGLLDFYGPGGISATGGSNGSNGGVPVQTGQWYHVVGTYDGSMLRLYLNGLLVGAQAAPWPGPTVDNDAFLIGGGNVLATGANGAGGTGTTLSGSVMEAAVYNTALTPTRIWTHYQAAGFVSGALTQPSATAGDRQVTLNWAAPANLGGGTLLGYQIQVSANGTTWTTLVTNTSSTSTAYVATGSAGGTALVNGSNYWFRVAAVTNSGVGAWSSPVVATPYASSAAPTNLGVSNPGSGQITLTWTAPTALGGGSILGYEIDQLNGTTWAQVTPNTGTTQTSYTISGLTNGQTYTFRVAAVTNLGTGAFVSAITMPLAQASAVTNLSAVSGNGQVALSWSTPVQPNAPAISGYLIAYTTYSTGGLPSNFQSWIATNNAVVIKAATVPATQFSFTISGLTNGTVYYVAVVPVTASGYGTLAESTAVPIASPLAPSGLAASYSTTNASGSATTSSTSVTLTWNVPTSNPFPYLQAYVVQQSSNGGTTWTTLTPATTAQSFTIGGLTLGATYHFRVAAINVVGTGAWARVAATPTLSNAVTMQPVTAPVGLSATALPSAAIQLNWAPPQSLFGATLLGYTIQVTAWTGVGPPSSWTTIAANTGSTGTTYTVSNLVPGNHYWFSVSAVTTAGTYAMATVPAQAVTQWGAVTGINIQYTPSANGLFQINWGAPVLPAAAVAPDVIGYMIEVSTNGGSSFTTLIQNTAWTYYRSPALAVGQTYIYRVSAFLSDGTYGAPSSISFTNQTPPTAPVAVGGTGGNGQIALSWSAPVSNGGNPVIGYFIQTSTDNANWTMVTPNTNSTGTTFTISGLNLATLYYVKVAAITAFGTGPSSVVQVTTLAAPAPPTSFAAVANSSQLVLSWAAPTAPYNTSVGVGSAYVIDGYRVQYSSDGVNWITASSLTNLTAAYVIGGLTNGTTYTVRVAVVTAGGVGAWAVLAGTPSGLPSMPLASVTPSSGQITVTWAASAPNGSPILNYQVAYTPSGGAKVTAAAGLSPSATTYTISGLTNGTPYLVSLIATNANGPSAAWQAWAVPSAPSAPVTGLTASTSATGLGTTTSPDSNSDGNTLIALSWNAPTALLQNQLGSAIGYQIMLSTNGSTWTILSPNSNLTNYYYDAVGLTPGTAIWFSVSPVTNFGIGQASIIPATVPVQPLSGSSPQPAMTSGVSLLTAVSGETSVTLSWSPPTVTNGIAIIGYQVQQSPTYCYSGQTTISSAATSPFTATNLTAVSSYCFGVAPLFLVNGVVVAGPANYIWGSTLVPTAAVTNLQVVTTPAADSTGSELITLTWAAPGNSFGQTVQAYQVSACSSTCASGWSVLASGLAPQATNTFLFSAQPGTVWTFKVVPLSLAGPGPATTTTLTLGASDGALITDTTLATSYVAVGLLTQLAGGVSFGSGGSYLTAPAAANYTGAHSEGITFNVASGRSGVLLGASDQQFAVSGVAPAKAGFWLWIDPNGLLCALSGVSSAQICSASSVWGSTHSAVFSMSSTGATLYLDGAAVGTTTTAPLGGLASVNLYWHVGYNDVSLLAANGFSAPAAAFIIGTLSNVFAVNTALTAAQVTSINTGIGTSQTSYQSALTATGASASNWVNLPLQPGAIGAALSANAPAPVAISVSANPGAPSYLNVTFGASAKAGVVAYEIDFCTSTTACFTTGSWTLARVINALTSPAMPTGTDTVTVPVSCSVTAGSFCAVRVIPITSSWGAGTTVGLAPSYVAGYEGATPAGAPVSTTPPNALTSIVGSAVLANASVGIGAQLTTLSWTAPTTITAGVSNLGYQVQRSTNSGATWQTLSSLVTGLAFTTETYGGLAEYRVALVTSLGIGQYAYVVASPAIGQIQTAVLGVDAAGLTSTASITAASSSVVLWFSTTQASQTLVVLGSTASGVIGSVYRSVTMNASGQLIATSNGVSTTATTASYNDGRWYELVVTFANSQTTLSIDGVQVGSNTSSAVTYTPPAGGTWRIGVKGAFAAAGIIGSALTAAQIQALWNASATPDTFATQLATLAPTFSSALQTTSATVTYATGSSVPTSVITVQPTSAVSAQLTIAPSSLAGVTSYVIKTCTGTCTAVSGNAAWTTVATIDANSTPALSVTATMRVALSGLPGGVTTYILVIPMVGSTAQLGSLTMVTPVTGINTVAVPSTPVPLVAQAATIALGTNGQAGQVTITWTVPSLLFGGSLTGYLMDECIGSCDPAGSVGWVTLSANNLSTTASKTIGGLVPGVTYSFRVAAVTTLGLGQYGYVIYTPLAVPTAPQYVSVTPDANSATVTWQAPILNGGSPVTGYRITQINDCMLNTSLLE